ncbi:hypothetical protein [Saccharibacillus brassicae]|uniref:ATP-grasp domain-containing protein n=1 Tax=Saccharibacillus brassicae TaxID=2583377 RepID=A0A4Y6UX61_SACBS|nr:hypothetical protein [Saccharibacillus brassicae]QDH21006.1 hypothetical protein FFV09_09175 [Saccharibacillus brassicae]
MNGLRVLITGGRAPCALDLARAFAARGAEVYAAESLEHPLCAASRAVKRSFRVPPPAQDPAGYAAALRDIVRREGIGLLLPTCEEIFYVSAYRGSFGPDCRVLAPPLGTLRELHSKWAFIALCARLGLAVPETVRLTFADGAGGSAGDSGEVGGDAEEGREAGSEAQWTGVAPSGAGESVGEGGAAPSEALSGGGGRGSGREEARIEGRIPRTAPGDPAYVLKPEFSRFSAGVSRHGSLGEAREHARRAGGSWVAQRYAAGELLCTYGAAHEGRLLAHAAYRAPQTASGASVCFEPDADPQVREWVVRFVERTNFSGQLAFDFIRTEEGELLPIECNPRATSGVHLLLAPQAAGGGTSRGDAEHAELSASGDRRRVPDLTDALARPDTVDAVILARPARTPMLLLPMLGSGLGQLTRPRRFAGWLRDLRGSRDVLLRRGDARVLPQALRMMLELRRRARSIGGSLSEASVADIGWDGQPIGEEGIDGRAARPND